MRSKSLSLLAFLLTAATLVSMTFAQTQKSGSGGAVAEVTRLEQEDLKADLANDPSFVKQYYAGGLHRWKQLGNLGHQGVHLQGYERPASQQDQQGRDERPQGSRLWQHGYREFQRNL